MYNYVECWRGRQIFTYALQPQFAEGYFPLYNINLSRHRKGRTQTEVIWEQGGHNKQDEDCYGEHYKYNKKL